MNYFGLRKYDAEWRKFMKRRRKVRVTHSLQALRLRAYWAQSGKCWWCKELLHRTSDASDPLQLTADHLIPLHAGGKTAPGNIVAACRKCNSGRHPELNKKPLRLHDKVKMWGDPKTYSPFEVLRKPWQRE
jgi:5-methylcytosine-specific restriction endonuclease McrA